MRVLQRVWYRGVHGIVNRYSYEGTTREYYGILLSITSDDRDASRGNFHGGIVGPLRTPLSTDLNPA